MPGLMRVYLCLCLSVVPHAEERAGGLHLLSAGLRLTQGPYGDRLDQWGDVQEARRFIPRRTPALEQTRAGTCT